jgi:hypothetical protein
LPSAWNPGGVTETDFTLSGSFAPFDVQPSRASLRNNILILTGVDNKVAMAPAGYGPPHPRGIGSLLTGRLLLNGNFPNNSGTSGFADGISIDQYIARKLGVRTIELAVRATQAGYDGAPSARMCYAGSNQPLPPIEDPFQAYATLFGSSGMTGDDARRLLARRKSVLDYVQQDLQAVEQRLGGDELARFQSHLDAVRQVETDLSNTGGGGGVGTCPPAPPVAQPGDTGTWYDRGGVMPARVGKMLMDLMVQALACDQRRIATLQWATASQIAWPEWVQYNGKPITLSHHGLSHAIVDGSNPDAPGMFAAVTAWYAEQFAYLCDKLRSVKETDGSTLLDNTILLWGNEFRYNHQALDMPFILAGGAQGYIRMGRHVSGGAQSHCRLLVSIANAMGVPTASFGDPTWGGGNGELVGLR